MGKAVLVLAFIVLFGELSAGILFCIKLVSLEGNLTIKMSLIFGVIIFTSFGISWSAHIMEKILF